MKEGGISARKAGQLIWEGLNGVVAFTVIG